MDRRNPFQLRVPKTLEKTAKSVIPVYQIRNDLLKNCFLTKHFLGKKYTYLNMYKCDCIHY